METKEITLHVKFVAKEEDGFGYYNYVFEDLEFQNYYYKYITCVRFPNWNQSVFKIDDEGFLTFRYVQGGVDEWYDGNEMIKYKNTNFIFLKFIPIKPKVEITEISLD